MLIRTAVCMNRYISLSFIALASFAIGGCEPPAARTEYSAPPAINPNGTIVGQIFVVTKGAETIKLALTDVQIFRSSDVSSKITDFTEMRTKKLKDAQQRRQEMIEKLQKFDSEMKTWESRFTGSKASDEYQTKARESQVQLALFEIQGEEIRATEADARNDTSTFFTDLPNPLQKVTTDADGKFSVSVPKTDRFVVVASASRQVGDNTERYRWVIRFALEGADSKGLMLTNKNVVGSFASENAL